MQKKERARLNAKLDALEMHGIDLIPGMLAPTGVANIFKLRVRGQVELRPMICEGPGRDERCFTLLLGAIEVEWVLQPEGAAAAAADCRTDLIANPRRRVPHERVN